MAHNNRQIEEWLGGMNSHIVAESICLAHNKTHMAEQLGGLHTISYYFRDFAQQMMKDKLKNSLMAGRHSHIVAGSILLSA